MNKKIALIGYGHVGKTLAERLVAIGYRVFVGVRNALGRESVNSHMSFHSIAEASEKASLLIVAVPAHAIPEVAKQLGDISKKIVIETSNILAAKPEGFESGFEALVALTNGKDIVKGFNAVGANNIGHTNFNGTKIDMFMAGDSIKGKKVVKQLAKELGFDRVWDFGGNDKVQLLERFGNVWVNLAIYQGYGRNIAFKILKRK